MVMETKNRKAAFVFPRCLRVRAALSRRRHRHGRKHRPASRPAGWRDWAALPGTVLRAILERFQTDLLRGTGPGLACASWRRAAVDDPLLWRRIDLASDEDMQRDAPAGWQAMARAAVDRSAGRCESFRGRADGEFLVYLADRYVLI
uniref:F-box domain-containing protein n=1 Tax=Hordeum vulgare subsp. vulgare TaxID=112509 RepID=A0A8I7BB35_HORVV